MTTRPRHSGASNRTSAATGNLLVGQSGGATAVINASLAGVIDAALAAVDGVGEVYGARYGIRGVLERDLVDLRRLPARTVEALRYTPSAALGSCRFRLGEEDAARALNVLRGLNIRYFLYIGGNDSAETALKLSEAARVADYDLRVVCVPKTIDNDLPDTDHCPGYGSAARFLALATMDSALCTASMPEHYPVKIIEVMGRDAGWLVAASALGKRHDDDPPHLLYPPERPLDPARFLEDVRRVHAAVGYCVVVVAETVRDMNGRALGAAGSQGFDAFGHALLGGAAQTLVQMVNGELGLRARFDKPGDLQRMSSLAVSLTDRAEAEQVGAAAVRAALAGTTGKMVTLVRRPGPEYACDTGLTDLARVANVHRAMPVEYLSADGLGITDAFRVYALPLLGEPLPRYASLDAARITL